MLRRFPVDLIRCSRICSVTHGLDPRVHPHRTDYCKVRDARGKPGASPRMTTKWIKIDREPLLKKIPCSLVPVVVLCGESRRDPHY
jgi:hypothetical protein